VELIIPFASAMAIDRGLLFSMWLRDYAPVIDRTMREIVGEYFVDSENELLAKADQILATRDPPHLAAVSSVIEDLLALRQRREASG